MNNKFWDERFSGNEFTYGTLPNQFLKEQLANLMPGKLIMPGEGEGRNAVYAAISGWDVDAVDFSESGKQKALKFAGNFDVTINYTVADLNEYNFEQNEYDAAGLVFLHMNPLLTKKVFTGLIRTLKPGGCLIAELFSKNQFGKTSGGPQNLEVLYSVDELLNYFRPLKTIIAEEKNIDLSEGDFHKGEASVVRYVGVKK
ncbi:MAG: class I SAM-dependent methyltransferase [Ignavibacteriaceae bacterium]|nr:class I SAM-dependent methyltransferase [Ignavibacteriaceae bacterium]